MTLPLAALSLLGCKRRLEEVGSEIRAQDYARRILGAAPDYRPIRADRDALAKSVAARRAHGWKVTEEVLRPVTVQLPAAEPGGSPRIMTMPLFLTWYDQYEFRQMMESLYFDELTPEERRAFLERDPRKRLVISPERAKKVMERHAAKELPSSWDEERFTRVLRQLETSADIGGAGQHGVSGRGMTTFSPTLVQHYLENAAWVYHCGHHYEPRPPADGSKDAFGHCLREPFPEAAVAIKATFNRRQTGVAMFDTTPGGFQKIMEREGADKASWKARGTRSGDLAVKRFEKDEDLRSIFHVRLRDQDDLIGDFLMTGLHVTTKETAEWVWVSLWWTPDGRGDFGADRPESILARGPEWAQYKMCTATMWDEKDPVVTEGADDPRVPESLRAVLRATYQHSKPATWCSNPFIEGMPRGANSNCIGCHQHAGPDGMPGSSDEIDLVQKTKVFPADFLASFYNAGDGFQADVRQVVDDFVER